MTAVTSRLIPLTVLIGVSAACGGGGTILGGGGSGAPTGSQRLELALAIEDETEAVASGLTLAAPGVPPSFVVAGCPAVNNTTDSDGDGIPDDQTRTYANPPCTFAGIRGGTFDVTGILRVQDSTPSDPFSYRLTATDLAWAATDPAGTRTFTATRNGTRSRTETDSSGVLTTAMTIVRERPNRASTTIDIVGVAEFVPAPAGVVNQPLSPGTITLAGTFRWRRSTEDWTITVATPIPLVYDPTCPATPQRITAGQVTLTGTISGAAGTLVLTFSGCGNDPTRAWVEAP